MIHVVGTVCPPEKQEEFNKWYNESHVPDLMKFKKLRKVTRYRNLHPSGDYPQFLTIYEFDNQKDAKEYLVSPERTAAGEDARKTREKLGYSGKWQVQFEVIKTWQK